MHQTTVRKIVFLILSSIVLLSSSICQETEVYGPKEEKEMSWEPEYTEEEKKINWITGLSSAIVPSLVIGGYNRFISRASWAKVQWDDIKDPSARDIKFDNDWYWTNFVLHPYQGSLYYMGARNSNFGKIGSLAISAVGSTIWEYAFETNEPSINDMIYTPIGGFALGEMLYRLAIDASDVWKGLGYLFNPDRLYTDFTTGHKPLGPHNNIYKFSLRTYLNASWGITYPQYGKSLDELYPGLLGVEANVEYNNPYGHDTNTPYSQFELTVGGGIGAGSGEGFKPAEKKIGYDIHIFSNGLLFSRTLPNELNTSTSLGFSMNYDFVWKNFYELTSLAPGFAIKQRVHLNKTRFDWQAHLGYVLLGTTDNFNIRRSNIDTRSYNYTTGAEFVGALKWSWDTGDSLDFSLHSYLLYDLPDKYEKTEAKGWEFINYAELKYEVPLSDKVYIGLENDFYYKQAWYKNYPNTKSFNYTAGLYFRYKVKGR